MCESYTSFAYSRMVRDRRCGLSGTGGTKTFLKPREMTQKHSSDEKHDLWDFWDFQELTVYRVPLGTQRFGLGVLDWSEYYLPPPPCEGPQSCEASSVFLLPMCHAPYVL